MKIVDMANARNMFYDRQSISLDICQMFAFGAFGTFGVSEGFKVLEVYNYVAPQR